MDAYMYDSHTHIYTILNANHKGLTHKKFGVKSYVIFLKFNEID